MAIKMDKGVDELTPEELEHRNLVNSEFPWKNTTAEDKDAGGANPGPKTVGRHPLDALAQELGEGLQQVAQHMVANYKDLSAVQFDRGCLSTLETVLASVKQMPRV